MVIFANLVWLPGILLASGYKERQVEMWKNYGSSG